MSHSHDLSEHDYAAANRAYFDEASAKYDGTEGAIALSKRLHSHIIAQYPFSADTTTVLDYACGTGLLSRQLVSETKSIFGVDISQGMVDQYNLWVSNHGISSEKMTAICHELKGEEGELENKKFDIIICSLAYHHFSDIDKTTSILAKHLNPSGKLVVVDFTFPEKEGVHGEIDDKFKHIIPHHRGMSEDMLKRAFEAAELAEFTIKDVGNIRLLQDTEVPLLFATGVKYL